MSEQQTVKCTYCDKQLKNTKRAIGAHIGYWHKEKAAELYRKEKSFSITCKECNTPVANSNNVLGRHLRKVHKLEFPEYLVKHEHDSQWPKCSCGCGEKLQWKKGGFSKFIKEHSTRGELNPMYGKRGKDSPNYGKVRNAEHRANYSRAAQKRWDENYDERIALLQTCEYRKKMSIAVKMSPHNEQRKKSISKGMKQWWQDNPEMRKRASDRAITLLEQNKIGPQAPFKAEYKFNPFSDKEEWMHSSWESAFLDACIEENIPVTKAHSIRIDYTDTHGIDRQYVPDFKGEGVLFEVKGHEKQDDLLKYRAAEGWCNEHDMEFVVFGRDVFLG